MIRAAKIDSNQAEIVTQLRSIPGISVRSVAQLKGFCDIIVGYKNQNFLFEIKQTEKSQLTFKEKLFHRQWKGQVKTVTNVEQILIAIGATYYANN